MGIFFWKSSFRSFLRPNQDNVDIDDNIIINNRQNFDAPTTRLPTSYTL